MPKLSDRVTHLSRILIYKGQIFNTQCTIFNIKLYFLVLFLIIDAYYNRIAA